ncbi:DUF2142 domain-containing protein [Nakamurella alba]|uniref:DUF2142 domain-containing protein n=1 Tax=Nakamurella alba TaxID=2665158 RepID=UPI0018A99699|nr:DUF2142 domain-containing protein [Nakamurella alba]
MPSQPSDDSTDDIATAHSDRTAGQGDPQTAGTTGPGPAELPTAELPVTPVQPGGTADSAGTVENAGTGGTAEDTGTPAPSPDRPADGAGEQPPMPLPTPLPRLTPPAPLPGPDLQKSDRQVSEQPTAQLPVVPAGVDGPGTAAGRTDDRSATQVLPAVSGSSAPGANPDPAATTVLSPALPTTVAASPADTAPTTEMRLGHREFMAGTAAGAPAPVKERKAVTGRLFAWAATFLMAALSLAFLVNTPPFYAADEAYQFDRVMAAEHGDILVTPGEFRISVGGASIQPVLLSGLVNLGRTNMADYTPMIRSERPSYNEAGGNDRKADAPTNYMSQHPPLYYALMGAVTYLIPGADDQPADLVLFILRGFNILLLLPLPFLFHLAARRFVGPGAAANAAAFLPLLVPGLLRGAATLNNDNLAILVGAAAAYCCVRIMLGDRSVKIAVWVSLLCVAASLTKGTVVFAMLIVPIAYIVQLIRLRRWPPAKTLVTLVIGAVLTGAWWITNYIRFGVVQPEGASAEQALAFGPPRPDGVPMDMDRFWTKVFEVMTARFWGSLGVLEPPAPPLWGTITLCAIVVVSAILVTALLAQRRLLLFAFYLQFVLLAASIVYESYSRYRTSLGIAGLQGRYYYPLLFAVVFPVAVAIAWLLRGGARWTPVVTAVLGTAVSIWFLLIMAFWLWIPFEDAVTPGTISAGVRRLIAFGPLPGVLTAGLLVLIAVLLVLGLFLTIRGAIRSAPTRFSTEYRAELDRAAAEKDAQRTDETPDGPGPAGAPAQVPAAL